MMLITSRLSDISVHFLLNQLPRASCASLQPVYVTCVCYYLDYLDVVSTVAICIILVIKVSGLERLIKVIY